MAFDADVRRWPTLAEFTAHLATVPRPSWLRKLTVHNTYIPNETQWRGMASMASMRQTYIAKGWSAGPHLYLAADCLNPNDKGIWQMTPLSTPGVHAGPCNSDALGIENVADWDARPPTPTQHQLLMGVLAALCRAWGLTAGDVLVHKECMTGRTCPGRYLPADTLRDDLRAFLAASGGAGVYRFPPLAVYERSDLTGKIAKYLPSDSQQDLVVDATGGPGYAPTAGHLADGSGFVDMRRLQRR